MGFGFNLFVILVLPLLILLSIIFVVYFFAKKQDKDALRIIKIWGIFFIILFLFVGLTSVIRFFTAKMQVTPSDIYGSYIIDKTKYAGKQANWQYDHYRFEITKQDSFLFYVTDKSKILRLYKGKVELGERRNLALKIDSPRHHIIEDNPTLYRTPFSFYYVFHSKYYNNVFFTKGKWEKDN